MVLFWCRKYSPAAGCSRVFNKLLTAAGRNIIQYLSGKLIQVDLQHWLLFLLWILYVLLHSFFADEKIKQYIQRSWGLKRYYRPLYSLFSAFGLAALLAWQYSIQSPLLIHSSWLAYISVLFILPGLLIMTVCIRKYFFELSGIQAFQKAEPVQPRLQQDGLHRYTRHPLYLGTLLFVWGLFLLFPYLDNLIAMLVITLYTLAGIRLEEKKLYLEYGEAYRQYAGRVPQLIPRPRGKK